MTDRVLAQYVCTWGKGVGGGLVRGFSFMTGFCCGSHEGDAMVPAHAEALATVAALESKTHVITKMRATSADSAAKMLCHQPRPSLIFRQ